MSKDWYKGKLVNIPETIELAESGTFSTSPALLMMRDVLLRIDQHPCEEDKERRSCCLFRHWVNEVLNFNNKIAK